MRAEKLGESLDARMAYAIQQKAELNNPLHPNHDAERAAMPWVPDEEWRKDFNNVNATIAQCGQSLIRALDGNKKNLGGVPTEQLEAQFKAEMIRSAADMTPDEWAALDKIRMQQVLTPKEKKK